MDFSLKELRKEHIRKNIVSELKKSEAELDTNLIQCCLDEIKGLECDNDYLEQCRMQISTKLSSLNHENSKTESYVVKTSIIKRVSTMIACIIVFLAIIPSVITFALGINLYEISKDFLLNLVDSEKITGDDIDHENSSNVTYYTSVEEMKSQEDISFPQITWIPNGYEIDTIMKSVFSNGVKYDIIYRYKNEFFCYSISTDLTEYIPERYLNTLIGERNIYVHKDGSFTVFQWSNDLLTYSLSSKYLKYDDLILIFNSLQ